MAAIKHFRFLLEGQKFFIWSDHKPLTYALHRVSDPWSDRQQCQEWCRKCVARQRAEATTQPRTPVEKISIPEQQFSWLAH